MSSDPLSILVVSDLHLGFNERDPVRGNDTFDTLDEVFTIASEHKVDLVLIAGNLFHDNKPSRRALQHAVETLRHHCLGDRNVQIEIVSDQKMNFHGRYGSVNYEDPNYNVQLPVFAIHGDRDDPSGDGGLSALDLLSSANLINYFGKNANSKDISLVPILISKGQTKLALYGLGHVRDEELAAALDQGTVKVGTPREAAGEWFNLLAIHQKRSKATGGGSASGKSINEMALPRKPVAMDLVVWGHEHECQTEGGMEGIQSNRNVTFDVIQPGSTVATELSEAEAKPKHVCILQLYGEKWKMSSIRLQTVRPFSFGEVVLEEHKGSTEHDLHSDEGLMDFLEEQVKEMLCQIAAQNPATPLTVQAENLRKYPLLKLRVDYTGYSTCNAQRFGQRFVNQVANPSDLLQFTRKLRKSGDEKVDDKANKGTSSTSHEPDSVGEVTSQIQSLVGEFLEQKQMRLLPEEVLHKVVFEDFVKKDSKNAIADTINRWLQVQQKELVKVTVDGVGTTSKEQEQRIESLMRDRAAKGTSREAPPSTTAAASGVREDDGGEEMDMDFQPAATLPRSAPAKASATKRGKAARATADEGWSDQAAIQLDDSDSDFGESPQARGKKPAAGSKRAATSKGRAPTQRAPAKKARTGSAAIEDDDEDESSRPTQQAPAGSTKSAFARTRRIK
ncbi:hypothetical protein AB1Y20_002019 [Prymnesium parvum]|uniref:Double-strand break repair protein n=1 Tax=Prymnesium parvum TaxID=97485 RepID=A0AB34J9S9_PRYPA